MADITMCQDKQCPRKAECYRYTANPNPYRQSYFCTSPLQENEECEYFTPNGKESK